MTRKHKSHTINIYREQTLSIHNKFQFDMERKALLIELKHEYEYRIVQKFRNKNDVTNDITKKNYHKYEVLQVVIIIQKNVKLLAILLSYLIGKFEKLDFKPHFASLL